MLPNKLIVNFLRVTRKSRKTTQKEKNHFLRFASYWKKIAISLFDEIVRMVQLHNFAGLTKLNLLKNLFYRKKMWLPWIIYSKSFKCCSHWNDYWKVNQWTNECEPLIGTISGSHWTRDKRLRCERNTSGFVPSCVSKVIE